jgi:hypothetical protein
MPAVVAAASAPMSNACINIMTQPEPFASFDRLCRSDPIANTCQVSLGQVHIDGVNLQLF